MNFSEMIGLAVSGYTVSDIKELDALRKENPEVMQLAKSGAKLSEIKELRSMADADESPANSAGPEHRESDDTPDYKKLYEEQKLKIDEMSLQIKEIQARNASNEIPGKAAEDPLQSFMDKL